MFRTNTQHVQTLAYSTAYTRPFSRILTKNAWFFWTMEHFSKIILSVRAARTTLTVTPRSRQLKHVRLHFLLRVEYLIALSTRKSAHFAAWQDRMTVISERSPMRNASTFDEPNDIRAHSEVVWNGSPHDECTYGTVGEPIRMLRMPPLKTNCWPSDEYQVALWHFTTDEKVFASLSLKQCGA